MSGGNIMIKDNEKLHCLKILKESINNIINEELTISDERKKVMDEAIAVSTLPEDIDVEFVNDLLINIRKEQLKLK